MFKADMLKIEKNVNVEGVKQKYSRAVSEMNIGDSVVLLTRNEMTSMRNAIRYAGHQAVSRKIEKGWRIWKMAKKD